MNKYLKSFVRGMNPSFIHRRIRLLAHALHPGKRTAEPWGEKPAEWYDAIYESRAHYSKHYTESRYYFLWAVLVDRMMRQDVNSILDLGCGPGQFGSLLFDKGFRHYCGLDLSPKCVELAKRTCPSFEFIAANILETDVLESREYDCLVALEFLEHVEEDLAVLQRVKPGTKFFGTVPDFPYVSHVRHFSSAEEVESRYGALFSSFRVDAFVKNPNGSVLYALEGTKL